MKEITILLLAVAYPSQAITAAVPQDSMWDQAETSLNEYRSKVNNGISSALINDYTTLSQTADSLIVSTVFNGTAEITAAYNKYMGEYSSVKQSAVDAGIDITVCINNFETIITNVGPENIDGLVQCVQGLIGTIITYISGASTGLVERYLGTVYQNEESILTCGPSDDNCLSNIVYALVQANARVEGQIANDLARDVGQFGMYKSKVDACGDQYISINEGKGNSILNGFKSCVEAQEK